MSSNSHGNNMEGFELRFYFLLFRLSISLSTSVCERLPGPFLSHTHHLPGFQHPFSRTARSFSPSWHGQTHLLSPSLPLSLILSGSPFSSCVVCFLPVTNHPRHSGSEQGIISPSLVTRRGRMGWLPLEAVHAIAARWSLVGVGWSQVCTALDIRGGVFMLCPADPLRWLGTEWTLSSLLPSPSMSLYTTQPLYMVTLDFLVA